MYSYRQLVQLYRENLDVLVLSIPEEVFCQKYGIDEQTFRNVAIMYSMGDYPLSNTTNALPSVGAVI